MRIGDFEIISTLGAGAAGVVYRATNLTTKRVVALKELHTDSPEARQQAVQEGRAMASFDSRHLVTIYNIHEIGERMYLESELVEGASLSSLTATDGLSAEATDRLLRELLEGIQAMHGVGLIHGDLKPDNVMIRSEGSAVIIDLGLASRGVATALGGTSQFMAPEMFRPPYRRDARTDLYSLGMTVYEAVVGRARMIELFPDILSGRGAALDHLWQSWALDRSTTAVPVDRIRPEIPETLAQLIADLMAKDPANRPASAAEALDRLSSARAPRATEAAPAREKSPTPNRVTTISGDKSPSRIPWRAIAAVVGLLILGAGAFLFYVTRSRNVLVETIPSGASLKSRGKALGVTTPTSLKIKGRGMRLNASRPGYKDADIRLPDSGPLAPVRLEPRCADPSVPRAEMKILVGDGFPVKFLDGITTPHHFVGNGCAHDLELGGDATDVSFAFPGLPNFPRETWPITTATAETIQARLRSLVIAWELALGWESADPKILLLRKIPGSPPRVENYECCDTRAPAVEVDRDVVAFSLDGSQAPLPEDGSFVAFIEISPDGEATLHANAPSSRVLRVPAGTSSWLTVQPPRTPMQFFVALAFPERPSFLAPFDPGGGEPFRLLKPDEVEALRDASRQQGSSWKRRYTVFEVK